MELNIAAGEADGGVREGVNGDGNRSILDEKFEFEISRKLCIE